MLQPPCAAPQNSFRHHPSDTENVFWISAQGKIDDSTGTGCRDGSHARRTKIRGDVEIEVMSSRKTRQNYILFHVLTEQTEKIF